MVALLLLVSQNPSVDRLIHDLGSDAVEIRERAMRRLIELGPKAAFKVSEAMKPDARR